MMSVVCRVSGAIAALAMGWSGAMAASVSPAAFVSQYEHGGASSRDFVDGLVESAIRVRSDSMSQITHGILNVNSPGSTGMNANVAFASDVTVDVSIEIVSPTLRSVIIEWSTKSPSLPIVEVGSTLGGETITNLDFFFGTSSSYFQDPDFRRVVSGSGTVFTSSGPGNNSFGLFTTELADGWFGGISFLSTGASQDVTGFGVHGYTATIVYEVVPTPGAAALALAGLIGVMGVRRRAMS